MPSPKPLIGITMGDPAGVGPEIVAKSLMRKDILSLCRPLVIGDEKAMTAISERFGLGLQIHSVAAVKDCKFETGTLEVLDLNNVNPNTFEYGKVSAMAGHAAFSAVKKAILLALDHQIDATVTAPINKEAIHLAGHRYSGHTEIYAHYTGVKDYAMMLVHGNFRVVHVSTHVALREACNRVKKERVLKVIRLADEACRKMGIRAPRIGVAGLNPHAGENGIFGSEEINEITPAIQEAVAAGINATGPFPPDSIYPKAKGGLFDIVVAMYHDQGHIPLKMVGFVWNAKKNTWNDVSGINITLGLPIIRSSVDHGTAFDLAGKGCASASSMVQAIRYGVKMTRHKPRLEEI